MPPLSVTKNLATKVFHYKQQRVLKITLSTQNFLLEKLVSNCLGRLHNHYNTMYLKKKRLPTKRSRL